MAEAVDVWRDTLDAGAMRDRRNGTCRRCLLGALGDIERDVPRTRHFCPTGVPKGSARRAPEIDRAIPAGVVPGLSTRKVGEVLLALPGRPVPAATVSRVARTLDRSVDAFHRRPLKNDCKAVMPDGALGRSVLVAPGIRHDGRKEIIDFRRAGSESAAERERFLDRPYHRGLTGEGLGMILRRWRQGPARRLAGRPARHPRPEVPGAQDPQHPRQGPRRPPGGRHERRHPARGARRRPPLRRPLAGHLPRGRRFPAQRSRRSARLLPLQDPCRAKAGQDHQCHRTTVPRGPQTNTAHGNIPGPDIDGPHPPRGLHPRRQVSGNRYPTLPDT